MKFCFRSSRLELRVRSAMASSACAEASAAVRSASCARSCAVSNSASVWPARTRSPSRTRTRRTSAASLARTVACDTACTVPGSSVSSARRRRSSRTISPAANSSGGFAAFLWAASSLARRCTLSAPTATIAVSASTTASHTRTLDFIPGAIIRARPAALPALRDEARFKRREPPPAPTNRLAEIGELPHAAIVGDDRDHLDQVIKIVVMEVAMEIEAARLHQAGGDRQRHPGEDGARAAAPPAHGMEQREQDKRETGIGDHPNEAVVAPHPGPEERELYERQRNKEAAKRAARGGKGAAGEHCGARDADHHDGRQPQRLEAKAGGRAADRRAERHRHEGGAP